MGSLGFRVWGLGFRVWGLGFRVLGFGFWVLGFKVLVLPPPVTVYIRGPIKGYIQPFYIHYPAVTEGGGGSTQGLGLGLRA